jgi:flavin-dependent dehydrogenase
MNTNSIYDCIVIGGGPAGSTVSTLLAQYGHKVLLLERSRFPRHHIGESLMPQTYWVFKRLGMLPKMTEANFVVKESVQFVSSSGQESQPYFFPDRDRNEWSYTWQVKRDKFDKLMLDNAREHGVEALEGVGVKEVLFEGQRAVGVRAVENGESRDIRCKW